MESFTPFFALLAVAGLPVLFRDSPHFRLAFSVFGMVIIFQSQWSTTTIKSVLSILIVFAGIYSYLRMFKTQDASHLILQVKSKFQQFLLIYLGFLSLVIFRFTSGDGSTSDFLRDGLNYFLLPFVALIGLEAALRGSKSTVFRICASAGTIAAVFDTLAWLGRRGVSFGNIQQLGLAASICYFPLAAYLLVAYFNSDGKKRLAGLGGLLLLASPVLAGGRQALLGLAIGLIGSFLITINGRARFRGGLVTLLASGSAALLIAFYWLPTTITSLFFDRLSFFQALNTKGLTVVTSDASAQTRLLENDFAFNLFQDHLFFGSGLGTRFPIFNLGYFQDVAFTLDTPIVILSKFGLVGCLALVLLLFSLIRMSFPRKSSEGLIAIEKYEGNSQSTRNFIFMSWILVALTISNGFPTENRGFLVFTLILLSLASPKSQNEPVKP